MRMRVRPSGLYINGDRYNYTSLDSFIKSPVEFIDIDMFGSEIDVLKGAESTITTYKPELLIHLHEDRIMRERERILGFLSEILRLGVNVVDEGDNLRVIIHDNPTNETEFRGHKFEYHRWGPEPIMYFTGWRSEVVLREKCLRDNDIVYDLGAHIGGWTIPAAIIGKHVYAFEPNHDCVDVLKENIFLNHLEKKVDLYAVALGATNNNEAKVNSCFTDNNTTVMVRLDEYEILPQPHFIKIDVEGAELDVLEGAQEVIKEYHPRMFIETHTFETHDTMEAVRKKVLEIYPYKVETVDNTYIFTP